jgi:hypothetical protein
MGHQTSTDFLVIQGKKGELLAAAVMLSIHGIEVFVPKSLVPGENKAPKDPPNGTKKI